MIKLLIELLLQQILCQTNISFADATITMLSYPSASVNFTGTTDKCWKFVVRGVQLYHHSTENVRQAWIKHHLNNETSQSNFSVVRIIGTSQILYTTPYDFSVDPNETAIYYSMKSTSNISITSLLNSQYSIVSNTAQQKYTITPNQVFYNGQYTYTFFTPQNIIEKRDLTDTILTSISVPSPLYIAMAVSPDFLIGIVWTAQSSFAIYNLTNLALINTYNPTVAPTSSVTGKVTFSQDSTLAILETDSFNPIIILNITGSANIVTNSITINDIIYEVDFYDSSNTIQFGRISQIQFTISTPLQYEQSIMVSPESTAI